MSFTIQEMAKKLKVDEETVRRWHRDHHIETVQVGNRGRIKIPNFEADRLLGINKPTNIAKSTIDYMEDASKNDNFAALLVLQKTIEELEILMNRFSNGYVYAVKNNSADEANINGYTFYTTDDDVKIFPSI